MSGLEEIAFCHGAPKKSDKQRENLKRVQNRQGTDLFDKRLSLISFVVQRVFHRFSVW